MSTILNTSLSQQRSQLSRGSFSRSTPPLRYLFKCIKVATAFMAFVGTAGEAAVSFGKNSNYRFPDEYRGGCFANFLTTNHLDVEVTYLPETTCHQASIYNAQNQPRTLIEERQLCYTSTNNRFDIDDKPGISPCSITVISWEFSKECSQIQLRLQQPPLITKFMEGPAKSTNVEDTKEYRLKLKSTIESLDKNLAKIKEQSHSWPPEKKLIEYKSTLRKQLKNLGLYQQHVLSLQDKKDSKIKTSQSQARNDVLKRMRLVAFKDFYSQKAQLLNESSFSSDQEVSLLKDELAIQQTWVKQFLGKVVNPESVKEKAIATQKQVLELSVFVEQEIKRIDTLYKSSVDASSMELSNFRDKSGLNMLSFHLNKMLKATNARHQSFQELKRKVDLLVSKVPQGPYRDVALDVPNFIIKYEEKLRLSMQELKLSIQKTLNSMPEDIQRDNLNKILEQLTEPTEKITFLMSNQENSTDLPRRDEL